MIMMELREEQYDKILEKGKKAKYAICDLIEALYMCEETEYDDHEDDIRYRRGHDDEYYGHGDYRRGMRMRRTGRYTY